MELSKDTVKKIMFLIVFSILTAVLLFNLDAVFSCIRFLIGILAPFIIGIIVAFMINLPMNFYERNLFPKRMKDKYKVMRKMARPISLVLSLVSIIGVIFLDIFVVVPELYQSVLSLGYTIQDFLPVAEAWILDMFPENESIVELIQSVNFDWEKILNSVLGFLKNGAGDMITGTFSFAKGLISGIAHFFIGFVFAIYLLLQKEKLRVQIEKVMHAFLKEKVIENINMVCSLTYKTFSSFLTGQCVEAVILGSMFFVVLGVLRFPYALLIGVLIGFTALIPMVGAFIGCAVGAFLILMISPVKALIFIGIFLLLQQIEGNLIYPHVVGNSIGLPSIWVLAAVSLGGSLMGIAGMLLFIPLVSVLYTLFKRYVYKRLKEKNYFKKLSETDENE